MYCSEGEAKELLTVCFALCTKPCSKKIGLLVSEHRHLAERTALNTKYQRLRIYIYANLVTGVWIQSKEKRQRERAIARLWSMGCRGQIIVSWLEEKFIIIVGFDTFFCS